MRLLLPRVGSLTRPTHMDGGQQALPSPLSSGKIRGSQRILPFSHGFLTDGTALRAVCSVPLVLNLFDAMLPSFIQLSGWGERSGALSTAVQVEITVLPSSSRGRVPWHRARILFRGATLWALIYVQPFRRYEPRQQAWEEAFLFCPHSYVPSRGTSRNPLPKRSTTACRRMSLLLVFLRYQPIFVQLMRPRDLVRNRHSTHASSALDLMSLCHDLARKRGRSAKGRVYKNHATQVLQRAVAAVYALEGCGSVRHWAPPEAALPRVGLASFGRRGATEARGRRLRNFGPVAPLMLPPWLVDLQGNSRPPSLVFSPSPCLVTFRPRQDPCHDASVPLRNASRMDGGWMEVKERR